MSYNNAPVFISNWVFKTIQNKNFDLEETIKLVDKTTFGVYSLDDIKKSRVSARTLFELAYMNAICTGLFQRLGFNLNSKYLESGFKELISIDVEKDCKRNVNTFLYNDGTNGYDCVLTVEGNCATGEEVKDPSSQYYELQISQDGLLIVVVKKDFLNHLVETKDNYLQFVLKCLELVYNRTSSISDPSIQKLLSTYLYYSSDRNFEATFRAKVMAYLC